MTWHYVTPFLVDTSLMIVVKDQNDRIDGAATLLSSGRMSFLSPNICVRLPWHAVSCANVNVIDLSWDSQLSFIYSQPSYMVVGACRLPVVTVRSIGVHTPAGVVYCCVLPVEGSPNRRAYWYYVRCSLHHSLRVQQPTRSQQRCVCQM